MANGTVPVHFVEATANDRLKKSFGDWFWRSIAIAAALHFLMLAFFPEMQAADVSYRADELEAVDVVREFEIPPPPEQIQRPAVPVLSTDVNIDEDITIAEVTFDENPVTDLPPPRTGEGVDVSSQPTFTPYEVRPEIRDRRALERLLVQNYPPMLKDAGVGGTTTLWVFIDESGTVQNTRVTQSSGYEQLDQAAQRVMQQVRFSPALNRDQRVPVWIQLPVTWQVR